MGKAEQALVNHLARADRARDRDHADVGRIAVHEVMLIKALQLPIAHAAGHGRDVIDVRLGDHGGHGGIHVASKEFVLAVLVPKRRKIVMRTHLSTQCCNRALVRDQGRRLVEVRTIGTGEGVINPLVNVQFDVLLATQALHDGRLRVRRTETIILGDMQHQPALEIGSLAQCMLDTHAIVANRARDAFEPACCQVSQFASQAETQHTSVADTFRTLPQRRQCCADVLHTLGLVKLLAQPQSALEIFTIVFQFDAGREAPEQIRHQHGITFFGVVIRDLAHIGIDTKNLLAQHNPRPPPCSRGGKVSAETAVCAADLDGLAHGLSLLDVVMVN
ncbi:hypothetical protein CSX04_08313 [Burkholderia cepacia]|nr:hypothetical protein CSX04_08313 [Burkholderia cepacia]